MKLFQLCPGQVVGQTEGKLNAGKEAEADAAAKKEKHVRSGEVADAAPVSIQFHVDRKEHRQLSVC